VLLAALLASGCVKVDKLPAIFIADEMRVSGEVCATQWDCSTMQRVLKSGDVVVLIDNTDNDQYVIVTVPQGSGWAVKDNLMQIGGPPGRIKAMVVSTTIVTSTEDSRQEIARFFPGLYTTIVKDQGTIVQVWVPELSEVKLRRDAIIVDPQRRVEQATRATPPPTPPVSLDAAVAGQAKVVESLYTQQPLTLTEEEFSSLLTLQMQANFRPLTGDGKLLANFAPGEVTLTLVIPSGNFLLVGDIGVNEAGLLEVKLADAAAELPTEGGTAALKLTPEMLDMVEGIANRALATYYVSVQQDLQIGDGVLVVSVK
jgi:hypothetical protein